MVLRYLIFLALIVGCSPNLETTEVTPESAVTRECPTAAEQEYLDQMGSKGVSAFTSLTMFGEELQEATTRKLLDEDWLYARETDVMVLQLMFDKLIAVQSPASTAHIYRQVEEIVRLNKEALLSIDTGLQEFDMEMLETGTGLMENIMPKLSALTRAVETFCD